MDIREGDCQGSCCCNYLPIRTLQCIARFTEGKSACVGTSGEAHVGCSNSKHLLRSVYWLLSLEREQCMHLLMSRVRGPMLYHRQVTLSLHGPCLRGLVHGRARTQTHGTWGRIAGAFHSVQRGHLQSAHHQFKLNVQTANVCGWSVFLTR